VHLSLAYDGEDRLRPRLRAGVAAAAPREAAEAALIRLLLAAALALLGTALAYLVLGLVLGVVGSWSQKTALDQAVGLAAHAALVFVRGVLPAVVATGAACIAWWRWRGSDPGVLATLAVALPLAGLVTILLLTSTIADWPRLEVRRAGDWIATVAMLGVAGAAADLLARRWLRRLRSASGDSGA